LVQRFVELASLPIPVSSKVSAQEPEYPSASQLDDTRWAISTGSGSIYILQTSAIGSEFSGSLVARYDLDTPFLLRSSHLVSATDVRLLLTRPTPAAGKDVKAHEKTFEMMEVSVDPALTNGVDEGPGKLNGRWSLTSGDLPYWCKWWQGGWMVLSGEEYRNAAEAGPSTSVANSSRTGIGAGSVDETTDVTRGDAAAPANTGETERTWPYSWTQTSDSISMTIPFPAGTKRPHLSISLEPSQLTLSLASSAPSTTSPLNDFLRRPTRSFWSDIDTQSSTFTYNSDKAILELELIKADDHSRWPSIFSPLDDDDSEEEEEEEVPETLDANTLAAVKASFSNIKTRQPGEEPTGNHPAMPALLTEEMDIDLDDDEDYDQAEGPFSDKGGKVGRDCFIGHIIDGSPKWTKTTSTTISLPMSSPPTEGEQPSSGVGLVIKSAIDGLHYQPPSSGDISKSAWTHASTTPALAFVLSSKRDIRLVRHITTSSDGTAVMAFDAGSYGAQAQGNVYVYYPPESKTHARQGVVGVSGRERGALLGVGTVRVGGKEVVLVLCEKELVVLHGVL
jgi:hypothetical protein